MLHLHMVGVGHSNSILVITYECLSKIPWGVGMKTTMLMFVNDTVMSWVKDIYIDLLCLCLSWDSPFWANILE